MNLVMILTSIPHHSCMGNPDECILMASCHCASCSCDPPPTAAAAAAPPTPPLSPAAHSNPAF